MGEIRGRFAPSPTGHIHLGNVFTFLLAWLQVRKENGTMVLRIEDLDYSRSKKIFEDDLIKDLKWLGLDWDEGPDLSNENYGPYRQNERRDLYEQVFSNLSTYPCYCTRAELAALAPHGLDREYPYLGTCRYKMNEFVKSNKEPSYRLMVPSEFKIEFIDLVQGRVVQNIATEAGDFVVKRADGTHAYQLAVVVDDALMGITHVLRGDDLLSSTPRQIFLYNLLNFKEPKFAHVPLLYDLDGHRLSKRQKDLSINFLRNSGIVPEAIIGYLGYISGLIPEFKRLKPIELISFFDLNKISTRKILVDLKEILYILSKEKENALTL